MRDYTNIKTVWDMPVGWAFWISTPSRWAGSFLRIENQLRFFHRKARIFKLTDISMLVFLRNW